jgi:hypothetical protein
MALVSAESLELEVPRPRQTQHDLVCLLYSLLYSSSARRFLVPTCESRYPFRRFAKPNAVFVRPFSHQSSAASGSDSSSALASESGRVTVIMVSPHSFCRVEASFA